MSSQRVGSTRVVAFRISSYLEAKEVLRLAIKSMSLIMIMVGGHSLDVSLNEVDTHERNSVDFFVLVNERERYAFLCYQYSSTLPNAGPTQNFQ